jgi:hypothetical protein
MRARILVRRATARRFRDRCSGPPITGRRQTFPRQLAEARDTPPMADLGHLSPLLRRRGCKVWSLWARVRGGDGCYQLHQPDGRRIGRWMSEPVQIAGLPPDRSFPGGE